MLITAFISECNGNVNWQRHHDLLYANARIAKAYIRGGGYLNC